MIKNPFGENDAVALELLGSACFVILSARLGCRTAVHCGRPGIGLSDTGCHIIFCREEMACGHIASFPKTTYLDGGYVDVYLFP